MSNATRAITVMPGDPLIVEKPPEPDPFAGWSMQYRPVEKMRPFDVHYLASQLMALAKGELLIFPDPDIGPTAFHYDVADELGDLAFSANRYIEAKEEGGNLAAAIMRELEFVAEEHRKLVERIREAFKDYIPNGWK